MRPLLLLTALLLTSCAVGGEMTAWEVDTDQQLAGATETVEIVVHDRHCLEGEEAQESISQPDIDYRDDAVVVTIRVRQPRDVQSCGAGPPTPYLLELDEPLDGRRLLMGTPDGPAPPSSEL